LQQQVNLLQQQVNLLQQQVNLLQQNFPAAWLLQQQFNKLAILTL
jgi:prefoldin subunit 5